MEKLVVVEQPEAMMESGRHESKSIDTGQLDELHAKLSGLEEELADVMEQRKVALARPMRGAEKDALRRQFDRQEARLQESIKAMKALLNED